MDIYNEHKLSYINPLLIFTYRKHKHYLNPYPNLVYFSPHSICLCNNVNIYYAKKIL